jgi:hypothetical protein
MKEEIIIFDNLCDNCMYKKENSNCRYFITDEPIINKVMQCFYYRKINEGEIK